LGDRDNLFAGARRSYSGFGRAWKPSEPKIAKKSIGRPGKPFAFIAPIGRPGKPFFRNRPPRRSQVEAEVEEDLHLYLYLCLWLCPDPSLCLAPLPELSKSSWL